MKKVIHLKDEQMYTEEDLITKVAWFYYKENLTQQQISDCIFLSRQKIQRLLQKARDLEIVSFQIKNPYANLLSMERKLIEKYSLRDAVIVPCTSPSDDDLLRKSFAKAGAFYLEHLIHQHGGSTIGLGWGDTIGYLADYFESPKIKTSVKIVSLIGNLMTDAAINPHIIAQQVAKKLAVPSYIIWAPAITKDKKSAEVFKSEPWINQVLQMASRADVILVAIGRFSSSSSLFRMGFLGNREFKRLKEKGVVSNILGQFFDMKGNLIDDEIHQRVIGLPLSMLKDRSKVVIGVGGGSSKFYGVQGALAGKYINVLITDEETAQKLLR